MVLFLLIYTYVFAITISILRFEIFNNILPVLAAACCYLADGNITRNTLIISQNNQIYSGGMALFTIWHDHGVLVITWPNILYLTVFR